MNSRDRIAKRVAQEFHSGDLVNLGIGIPILCTNFIPEGTQVILQAENGILGLAPLEPSKEIMPYCFDAGNVYCDILPEGAVVDSATAFGMIRGGHLAATVLGAIQVDAEGNLANWMVPGGKFAGMGGAMDLVSGSKRVIVATEHCDKNGAPKIIQRCTYPLTGAKVVNLIVTELAVIEVTPEGLLLTEKAPDITLDGLRAKTGAELIISPNLKEF